MDREQLLYVSEKDAPVPTPVGCPNQESRDFGIELDASQSTVRVAHSNCVDEPKKRENYTLIALGPDNTVTTCQHCRATVKTSVKYTSTSRTHIAGALWCLICCCCCIPFCCDSAKNSDHYCPACSKYIGTYEK